LRARLAGQPEVIYDSLQDPPLSQEVQVYVYSENCSSGRRLGGHGVAGAEQQRYGKAKNRERVLQAIKESNYQPNLLARQLRTARSNMILVMVSNIANPFAPRW
jgi:hypothetical protein